MNCYLQEVICVYPETYTVKRGPLSNAKCFDIPFWYYREVAYAKLRTIFVTI